MKKLALLLAALSVASVSYAKEVVPVVEPVVVEEPVVVAPALTVTSVGQYIEFDNTSGGEDIGEGVHLGNKVNLSYGDDWAFGLTARKTWSMDTDDGVDSANHRIELAATRKFDNWTLGTKWRGEKNYDGIYLNTSYNYGALSGWGYVTYRSYDNASDRWYVEAEPLQYKLGPVQLAWYVEYTKFVSPEEDFMNNITDDTPGNPAVLEDELNNQIRVRGNFYEGQQLTLGLEYRYQVSDSDIYEVYRAKKVNDDQHSVQLSAAYKVTDNLTVDGYYLYEMNSYEIETKRNGTFSNVPDNYYGELCIGWNYKF